MLDGSVTGLHLAVTNRFQPLQQLHVADMIVKNALKTKTSNTNNGCISELVLFRQKNKW